MRRGETRLYGRAMDPTLFLVSLGALIALCVLPVVVWKVRKWHEGKQGTTSNVAVMQDRERRRAFEAAVASGLILPDGRRRCQASSSCQDAATKHPPKFVRDEGWLDFIRRAFGAPPRLRIDEDVEAAHRFCESHAHLAFQDAHLELADVERERAEALRQVEVRIGHYERTGAAVRLAKIITEHEAAATARKRTPKSEAGKVVPIRSAAGG